jgi:nucleotide-binding universal stress UspA family protein
MIKHILVAVDGSENSDKALNYGIYLAKKLNAALHIQHVIDVVFLENPFLHDLSGAMGFEPFMDFSGKVSDILRQRGNQILADANAVCKKAGMECKTYLDTGVVTKEIFEREKLVDLVVIGQKGVNSQFDRKILGSTTEGLTRRLTKPLLISPGQFQEVKHILLAYDDSNAAKKGMEFAVGFCKDMNLPLSVVNINKDETVSRTILNSVKSYIEPYRIAFDTVTKTGNTEKVLKSMLDTDSYDLLIMGAHGHSRIVEMVLGSTAEYVIRNTNKPVIVTKS